MDSDIDINMQFARYWFSLPSVEQGIQCTGRQMLDSIALTPNLETVRYWASQAFEAGARAAAQCTLNKLAYAAAQLDGLVADLYTPSELFDTSREMLHTYYQEQLELNL